MKISIKSGLKTVFTLLMIIVYSYLPLAGCSKIRVSQPSNPLFRLTGPVGRGVKRADSFYQKAQYEQCAEELKKLLVDDPTNPVVHYNLGLTYAGQKKYDLAEQEYYLAIQQQVEFSEAFIGLGDLYRLQGHYEKSLDLYLYAQKILPMSLKIRVCIAKTYEEMGKLSLAIKQYQNCLQIEKNSAAIYLNLGNAYYRVGEEKKAVSIYEKALEVDPNYADIYHNLGFIYQKNKDLEKAASLYQKALEKNKTSAPSHINLGFLYRLKGQYLLAREHYQQALAIDPNCPEALLNMGILNELYLEQPSEAIKYYERYVCQNQSPELPKVKEWLNLLQKK